MGEWYFTYLPTQPHLDALAAHFWKRLQASFFGGKTPRPQVLNWKGLLILSLVSLMAHKHRKRQRGSNVGALISKWFSSPAQMCSLVAGLSVRHQGQDTLPTQYWQKSAFKNLKPPFRRDRNTVYSPLLAKILNWKLREVFTLKYFSKTLRNSNSFGRLRRWPRRE